MRTRPRGNKETKPRLCGVCADCAADTGAHGVDVDRHCGVRERESIRATNHVDPDYGDTYLDWRPSLRAED